MKSRDATLDLIRGLSALLVMLYHLRGFIFHDFSELSSSGLLTKAFYFITSLGHQAVMVFFVLSGYFVGGSVISGLMNRRFSWAGYSRSRLTRLWVVLLPALLLTLAVDMIGIGWNPDAYAGEFRTRFMSGPTEIQPAVHDGLSFLGNLCFLQTVTVPVYGSNGPLWSLANEFWYYVMFPLLAVSLVQISRLERRWISLFQLLLFLLVAWWLPIGLLSSGLIWLMGAGAWWLLKKIEIGAQIKGDPILGYRLVRGWPLRITGGLLFFGTLVISKTSHWLGSDYAVGVAFALWLIALPGTSSGNGLWKRLAMGLSEISYTLYVVHFPLMFFAASTLLNGRQFPPDVEGYLWFMMLATLITAVSAIMWWLFERNTDRLRRRLWRHRPIR